MKIEKKHIEISNPSDCCGCTACASICSHDAISMQPDALGFLYPKVDESKCVECGICIKVCAFHSNYDRSHNFDTPIVYGGRHKDINEVRKSRSGAAFVALSDYVLEQGGVVYGVGYKDHFRVAHKRATTKEERDELRGSKYVQSDLTGVFRSVRQDLKDGLFVLFSGTPCQTAGLSTYIGEKLRENMLLVDIVCHGVPGPYLWRDYLYYLEKKEGATVRIVNFRDKEEYGWYEHKETFVFDDVCAGEEGKMNYDVVFYSEIALRKSCAVCPFANTNRPSDITIGDFWGYEKIKPEANVDNLGVSLILLNTPKGLDFFKKVEQSMDVFPVNSEDYLQPNLVAPTELHPLRDEFEKYYAKHGFVSTMNRFRLMGWRRSLNQFNALQISRVKKYFNIIFHLKL